MKHKKDMNTSGSGNSGLAGPGARAASAVVQPPRLQIDKAARAAQLGQKPAVLWFTGLSGAGKSTIADLVATKLHAAGHLTYVLDGDKLRLGLNSDLGFSEADRRENIRRVGEVARLMVDAGVLVLAAFISPFRADRAAVRRLLAPDEFFEVHVHAPLELAEMRDPKGLYAKARRGQLKDFTGIDSPYEAPENPDLRIDTATSTAEEAGEQVIGLLRSAGVVRT